MSNQSFFDLPASDLKLTPNAIEASIQNLLSNNNGAPNDQDPSQDCQTVQPLPGFCLKSLKVNTNEKFFINVCQTDCIPPPKDITEKELEAILASQDPSAYRIPMSISEPHLATDKSNNQVDVCDIAVNPSFLHKIQTSFHFRNFFVALIAEALSEKYNVQLNIEKSIILKNRKVIGELVCHRIRKNCLSSKPAALIQEINNLTVSEPLYKLRVRMRGEEMKELQAEFFLPKCSTVKDFTLDVGEDRIVVESVTQKYHFDKFVSFNLAHQSAVAIFDKSTRMLQVRAPILPN